MISSEQLKQPANYQESLRAFGKLFKGFEKQDIRLILEFSEFDVIATYKILSILVSSEKAAPVVKRLLDQPEKSDKVLSDLLEKYHQSPMAHSQLPTTIMRLTQSHEQEKKVQNKVKNMPFFKKLPKTLFIQIMLFLNPVELTQFIKMQPEFEEAYLSNPKQREAYYKNIFQVLFSHQVPKLPEPSHFTNLKDYIISHPLEFGPNIRHAANNDMRMLVWHCSPESFKLPKEYYLATYGDYEHVYKHAPRVNFNGYYVFREKYMRRGEYSLDVVGRPFFVVYYYRYMRFFPDGAILYKLSNRKLTQEQIKNHLSADRLADESDEVMKGEYLQYKQQVFIRFSRSTSLFCYDCIIETTETPFDTLRIQRFGLQLIDDTMMAQQIYREKPHQQLKTFIYKAEPSLAQQNSEQMQVCSL